jgi:hypothetical protein
MVEGIKFKRYYVSRRVRNPFRATLYFLVQRQKIWRRCILPHRNIVHIERTHRVIGRKLLIFTLFNLVKLCETLCALMCLCGEKILFHKNVPKIYFIILIISLSNCSDKPELIPSQSQEILFLGHIYQKTNKIDPRLEKINFRKFDQVWLGGDLCIETTREKNTLRYLDRIFDLDHSGTHWAMGNHDVRNGNLDWIREATGRELFYFEKMGKLGMLVLDSNIEDDCIELQQQFELIDNLPLEVEGLSHLIVMTHHTIWGNQIQGINMWETANANRPFWEVLCEPVVNFDQSILPVLREIQARGVQVICLAGDFGQRAYQFSHQSNEGIWYLGAGFNKGFSKDLDPEDKAILFDYDPMAETLDWRFLTTTELAEW